MLKTSALAATLLALVHAGSSAKTPVGGFVMPSLDDEKATYRAFGKTWKTEAEPNYPSAKGFTMTNPDVHGDTEGDDLWTYLMMYLRTNQKGYLERAQAWANYHMNQYVKCQGSENSTLCFDEQAFLLCHIYGWGLIAWYEFTGDAKALEAAEALGDRLDKFLSTSANKAYPVPGTFKADFYGARGPARHLHLFTRLAEATGKKRWIDARNLMIDIWMKSPDWDSRGMYFVSDYTTDYKLGEGTYASGVRMISSFQLGVLTEAFAHAYRTTQDARIKEKMISMARFVEKYGLDPKYDYTGGHLGLKNGIIFHDYSAKGEPSFWDPSYTTSLVNTLAWGFKLTGDSALLRKAFYFYDRGNKGIYGEPVKRLLSAGEVHHFVDTRFSTAMENIYLDYNKGELQYTWALFDRGGPGAPVLGTPRKLSGLKTLVQPGIVRFSGSALDGVGKAVITDLQGNVVSDLSRSVSSGSGLQWDTRSAPSGVFFLTLESTQGAQSQPILLGK